jgi:transposase InsO family protein
MPWKRTSVVEERIRFIVGALQPAVNFRALCKDFGVSRRTGYRWFNRYLEVGSIPRVGELSRRPHRSPTKTDPKHERRVIELRQRHGWGGKKLQVILAREGIQLPVITINRIIKRNGLIKPEIPHRPALNRFQRESCNQLWQMDFKGVVSLSRGRCYPLSVLDDHSRFAVGLYALGNQYGEAVHSCLIDSFERYGIPEAMLMDHGTPWWSNTNGHGLTRLSVSLIKQGVELCWSAVRHPQTQGKVERFHRTLQDSVLGRGRPRTLADLREAFRCFREEYNNIRPHEALEMAVPAHRYKPSRRAYNPHPRSWEYPQGSIVKRLNTQGCLDYKNRRYFVCEALMNEHVRIEHVDKNILISYRHMCTERHLI